MITKCIKITLLFIFLVHLVSTSVKAETRAYLITPGFYEPIPEYINGRVYFWKSFGMEYKSGTVVLSGTPDGTGYITVGDWLDLNMSYPHQGSLQLIGFNKNCLSYHDLYPPQDITSFFKSYLNNGFHGMLIRLSHWCVRPKTIGPIYIVHTIPDTTPTPSPTPTAVPSPTPVPFLDLPWDYESKGMDFVDAALSMSSYFDHEYPLLSGGISEPDNAIDALLSFEGYPKSNKSYTGHDGYDYSSKAKVKLGDPVLAAASGTARYINTCGACGNMILIDHGNGYQTRYLHLQKDGLITTDPTETVSVSAGQQIGKVGFTGNVDPPGRDGAHIHFGVFQDKNEDGNFEDNIPDGVTDPFGWKSKDADPWENYTFQYNGTQKQGNKSFYLWKQTVDERNGEVSPGGGIFTIHKATLDFPADTTDMTLDLNFGVSPVVEPSADLVSVGTGYSVEAKDLLGNVVSTFLRPFNLIIDFFSYDLSHLKPETLSIYSSQDGINWTKEQTTLDMTNKKASAAVNHLTQFALMAERVDTEAPTTKIHLNGEQGEENKFRSEVTASFESADNEGGLGVDYTAVKIDAPDGNKEWDSYKVPMIFSTEGDYMLEYYSVDKDGNTEELKSIGFSIDTTPPEAEIMYDLNSYDLVIVGRDGINPATVNKIDLGKQQEKVIVADNAGNTLTIMDKDRDKGKKAVMNIYSLQYNNETPIDLGDNKISFNAQTDKDNALKSLHQLFNVKGERKLELDYSSKTNKTKVIVKVKGEDKEKEQLEGIAILKLFSNKGILDYQY